MGAVATQIVTKNALKLLGEVAYDYDNPGFLQFYFVFLCTLS
jgi:hypothetical protein